MMSHQDAGLIGAAEPDRDTRCQPLGIWKVAQEQPGVRAVCCGTCCRRCSP